MNVRTVTLVVSTPVVSCTVKYFYGRPSMAKFVELLNTKSDRERYRLMLYVNNVLK